MNLERTPPSDIEAEQAVLGSILLDPNQLVRVKARIQPNDLYRTSHRTIYQAMLHLDEKGSKPDPLLVQRAIPLVDPTANGDATALLPDLLDVVPNPAHASHYAEIVAQAADRRRIISASTESIAAAYENREEPTKIQRKAMEGLGSSVRTSPADELPWKTAEDAEDELVEPEWLWKRYIALERVTILSGHGGCGKTTLYYGALAAMLAGRPFLGAKTAPTTAVILSEEAPSDWRPRAKRFNIHDCAWLDRAALSPKQPLDDYCEAAHKKALSIGAYVIVIDSWGKWAGFGKDEEKDAGATETALQPVYALAARGMAVLLIHHLRKADGGEGTGMRGSGHLLAAVETSLELRRFQVGREQESDDPRVLSAAKSRYPDPPPDVVYAHDPHNDAQAAFHLLGDPKTARKNHAVRRAVSAVQAHPGWVDARTVRETLGARDSATRSALQTAYADGQIDRRGNGSRGNPYEYRANEAPNPW